VTQASGQVADSTLRDPKLAQGLCQGALVVSLRPPARGVPEATCAPRRGIVSLCAWTSPLAIPCESSSPAAAPPSRGLPGPAARLRRLLPPSCAAGGGGRWQRQGEKVALSFLSSKAALQGRDHLLIDATERVSHRSQDAAKQREHYSGKKRSIR
jgi:hypothetical protein